MFITSIDITQIETASQFSRMIQCLLLAALDHNASLRSDANPGDGDRDRPIEIRDDSFIVVDQTGSLDWRVTITDAEGPKPVQLTAGERRVIALARKVGANRAAAVLEAIDADDDRGDDDPPTADEIEICKAARRLGLCPAAAIVRLTVEPCDQSGMDIEKVVTMEQAREQLEDFLRLEASLTYTTGDPPAE